MNAIEVSGLVKQYGPMRALAGVSLEIPAATVHLVAGPNGAGKSTLLRILSALTRPTAGSVRILGENPFGPRRAEVRRHIGWLGAAAGLYGDLTVEENLSFAARLCGADRDRIETALDDFALAAFRHRRARTLSEGYRRRAGLARALLSRPRIVLLDEPWNGLDAEASERLVKVLRDHRSRGDTVLVTAHRTVGALELADRVVTLARGELVAVENGGA